MIGAVCAEAENSNDSVASKFQWQRIHIPGVGTSVLALAVHPRHPEIMLVGGYDFGIRRSEDGGKSWQPVRGLSVPMVNSIVFDPAEPERVWAATLTGPYLSEDGGKSWQPKRFGMPQAEPWSFAAPIVDLVLDELNPGRIVAFGGSRIDLLPPGTPGLGLVWESRDYGDSWTPIATIQLPEQNNGLNIRQGGCVPEFPELMYAVTWNHGIFTSEDSGLNWKPVNNGLPHFNITRLAFNPKNPNNLLLS
ncbi:MAG: hypothetical protein D6820_02530, partial [Lentisphaerae bacterium]